MQRGKKFLWQYLPFHLLIIFIALVVISWYATGLLRVLYLDRTASDLEARSRLVGKLVLDDLKRNRYSFIQIQCQNLGLELETRFTVILPSGQVVGDSDEDPANMDNHATRPEIIEAYGGRVGQSTRFSNTLKKDMMYLAVPLNENGDIIAVARSSLSVSDLTTAIKALYRRIILVGFIIALGASLISLFLSRRMKRPIEMLKEGALRFGRGDLAHRVYISDPEEFMILGDAMNFMATQLDERIHTITSQRNELECVLASMIEAVIVINPDERILRFNQAAGELFDVDPSEAKNRSIQEVTRNIQMVRFIRETLSNQQTAEQEIVLHEREDRFLQAHSTPLLDFESKIIGVLVVLNDITRLKRLENIRNDFVANVSHELKTPITAIKGSVETLQEGALKSVEDTKRFLGIIIKHTDRLHAIIEDLLNLSRIEQEAEKHQIVLEELSLIQILKEAISICQDKASKKKSEIELICDPNLTAQINAPLLEEAMINLIDNAVKYSQPNGQILVKARVEEGEVILEVRDQGCGIPPEHHARVFERFYRVDKARSRELGGTGLGLAIVKHIVQAHGGRVTLESTPNQGSTFPIRLHKG